MTIKKLFILFILFISLAASAEDEYTRFIHLQMDFISQMNENNISKEQIETILSNQKESYAHAIDNVMNNKQEFIKNINLYESEIFSLQKIIKINKRAHNKYAVIRDEVQLKSYKILANQNRMFQNILTSLEYANGDEFSKLLNEFIVQNQLQNQELTDVDYKPILELEGKSKTLIQAKENILEFYALLEINQDMVNHIYLFESRMFRLNKYSKYHLISTVLYINSFKIVKNMNSILEIYGLNVIKILFITFLIAIIYFIRKVLYVALERYIIELNHLKKYAKEISDSIRQSINIVIIIINLNMIIFVYNDFISTDATSKFFNILYGFFFTLIVYKILNIVASIKIQEIDTQNKQIKNEVINVGIKIINFIIIMIGMLIVLHFAGVNLTAILSGLGIGGFAVALAAKDSLANFFGTLSILFSDVFSQGDWIEIDGNEGVVVEIGLRVTTIRTFDNALIAIPNAILATKDVKNWDKRRLGRRIKMSLGIKYNSKSNDIKNAVQEIRDMLNAHPQIATEKTAYKYNVAKSAKLVSKDDSQGIKRNLLVYLDEFSDSSINILVYCFTKSVNWSDWLDTKEDVMHKIMHILEKNSLEFAFPSLSIYNEDMKK